MSTENERHRRQILKNLTEGYELLEKQLAYAADPNRVDVQTLYDFLTRKREIEKYEKGANSWDLTPRETLDTLDELEEWFTSRKLDYPFPERIKEQREFWEGKLPGAKKRVSSTE